MRCLCRRQQQRDLSPATSNNTKENMMTLLIKICSFPKYMVMSLN